MNNELVDEVARLRAENVSLRRALTVSLRDRLVCWLLDTAMTVGNQKVIYRPPTQEQMAKELYAKRESVNRELMQLLRLGLIERAGLGTQRKSLIISMKLEYPESAKRPA